MQLITDFVDYYDEHFSGKGETFARFMKYEMKRDNIFKYLSFLGLPVPRYARTEIIHQHIEYPLKSQVVVYKDERGHNGHGKEKMPLIDAVEKYPGCLAAEYIHPQDGENKSVRHVQIGDKSFILEYRSTDDWRSNCGNYEINLVHFLDQYFHKRIQLPLFAIDYIISDDNIMYAVDFDIAPKIEGTGIDDILPPKDAAESIEQTYQVLKNTQNAEENLLETTV